MSQPRSSQPMNLAAERWLLIYSTIVALAIMAWWLVPAIAAPYLLPISIGVTVLLVGPYSIWWLRVLTGSKSGQGAAIISLLVGLLLSLIAAGATWLSFVPDIDGMVQLPTSSIGQLHYTGGITLPAYVVIALVWCCVIMIKHKRRKQ